MLLVFPFAPPQKYTQNPPRNNTRKIINNHNENIKKSKDHQHKKQAYSSKES